MATPSVTLMPVTNKNSGIDILVPRLKEEEAPLGGISILYEIHVITSLDLFKTRLHKSGDVVQFKLYKAFREFEDLYTKLNKKYPKAGLPPVPKTSTADKYSDEDRLDVLDTFMCEVSKNKEICHSSTFTQFIGINSNRMPSFSVPIDPNDTSDKTEEVPDSDKDASPEVFPKVKSSVVKSQSAAVQKRNADLFEEVKLINSVSNISANVKKSSQGLFDDFEDENLFSSKPVESAPQKVEELKRTDPPVEVKKQPKKLKEKESSDLNVDDSQIIIKDRKQGELSLFNEQDLGDYITKEEEELFLVTSPNTEAKKNSLLVTENEILSPEEDKNEELREKQKEIKMMLSILQPNVELEQMTQNCCLPSENDVAIYSLNENLDDLLDLAPLPDTPLPRTTSLSQELGETERPKPVPLPRRKSLGKTETDSKQKPEVMPRKVFLSKTDNPPQPTIRPPVPTKPSVQAKPVPPTKPKPPPKKSKPTTLVENKTTDLDAANANNSAPRTDNISNLAGDLQDLDILKYIEQEEKSLDAQLNLFE